MCGTCQHKWDLRPDVNRYLLLRATSHTSVPTDLQNHVVWSRTLKSSVKSYVSGPSTKCYFYEFLFMRIHTHDENRINQQLWAFGVPWSPDFVLGLRPRGGFLKTIKVTMKHDSLDAKNPCRFSIPLAFTYILRWSLKRSVKQTWTGSAFSTNESALKCIGHMLSASCVKWPSLAPRNLLGIKSCVNMRMRRQGAWVRCLNMSGPCIMRDWQLQVSYIVPNLTLWISWSTHACKVLDLIVDTSDSSMYTIWSLDRLEVLTHAVIMCESQRLSFKV